MTTASNQQPRSARHPIDFKTIGITVKGGAVEVDETLERVVKLLKARKLKCLIHSSATEEQQALTDGSGSYDKLAKSCDLVIVIGGDGTLLAAARHLFKHGVPLLGINLGRLGFLVDVSPDELETHLNSVLDGDYQSEQRLLLKGTVSRDDEVIDEAVALNDVVLHTRKLPRMLEFDTYIEGHFINSHRADGFIVATPTGSTAYALSGGGPIMHPGLKAITLVPICPHTLSDRPLVLPASCEVEVELRKDQATPALVSFDGQHHFPLEPGDAISITRATRRLTLIHPPEYDYFGILRNKLHWGRNETPHR